MLIHWITSNSHPGQAACLADRMNSGLEEEEGGTRRERGEVVVEVFVV